MKKKMMMMNDHMNMSMHVVVAAAAAAAGGGGGGGCHPSWLPGSLQNDIICVVTIVGFHDQRVNSGITISIARFGLQLL